jgi:hypothetical protein
MVCQLHHKTDEGVKTAWGMHHDLAACFVWKQVMLRFPSRASRLVEVQWWVVHVTSSRRSCGDQVEDGWVNATDCVGPYYAYLSVFFVLGTRGILVM